MPFQSEIRDSEINALIEKVSRENYFKYLKSINFYKLRMLENQRITFDFPVTALIGTNGGGKTTVLGAAGSIYRDIKPNQFFAKSGKLDEGMANWKAEYTLIDKTIRQNDTLRRSATYKNYRWNRDSLFRECVFFGVARTVPANERIELRKCASPSFEIEPNSIIDLQDIVKDAAKCILGKDVSNFNTVQIDKKGKVTLLAGEVNGIRYSEFHFGAGESSIIRMVMAMESIEDYSLILIEEIENGLHPVATIRLVEYLISLATRKKTQIIFTTHSNDALAPLPHCAIWACIDGNLVQGKLSVHSIRTITGQVEKRLAIFVEDEFAQSWIHMLLRSTSNISLDSIEIHPMYGDGTAVQMNDYHNADPSRTFDSICILDGDSKQEESEENNVFRLPGESPESYIYDKVLDKISECKGKLAVSLHLDFGEQNSIEQIVKDTRLTNRDPHLLYSQVAEKIGFLPEESVRNAFIYNWIQLYKSEVNEIIEKIKSFLPKE